MAVKLFLCGDVMTGRGLDQVLPHSVAPRLLEPFVTSAKEYVALAERAHGPIRPPVGYRAIWGEALRVLDRASPAVRIANLETSVTTSEDAEPKGINYRMHPANVALLAGAGIDCCVLANNHVLDWGRGGLLETLATLAGAGLRTAGAGEDLEQARAPAILEAGGARVLVHAFGTIDSGIPRHWAAGVRRPGVHLLPDLSAATVSSVRRLMARSRRPGDLVVASIHWGPNWGYEVAPEHRSFAHRLIDEASVDVLHGHSSHHPKGVEVYRDRPILYGCGDFLNDYEGITGHEEYRGDLVLMYFPVFDASGRLVRFTMTPLQIRNFRLRRPDAADNDWLGGTLDRECRRFGHRVSATGDDGLELVWA